MGAFQGWLIKKDGIIIPTSLMQYNNYSSTPNQRQDLDPYVDVTGYLHRSVVEHKRTKIEFSLKPMHLNEMEIFIGFLKNRDKCKLDYWNDEDFKYASGFFYAPDITYSYHFVDTKNKDIFYNPTAISFIEY